MTGTFTTRDRQPQPRLCHVPAARIIGRGTGTTPSTHHGTRWRAFPVEGSKAWRDAQPGFLGRLLSR